MRLDPADFSKPPLPGLRAIWFGHASVYLEIDGARIMLDPMLSEYASPLARVGPKRFHAPPIALADLPQIDVVVISHDHYDHLDMPVARTLAARGSRFVVPLGIGAHLRALGSSAARSPSSIGTSADVGGLNITATPSATIPAAACGIRTKRCGRLGS